MKHHLNRALSVVALLMLSLSTWASGEVTISVVPANAGTVTSAISDGVCTLTVTPAQGYYLTAANLQAVTILNGEAMQAPRRAIPINDGALAISATNADADPSGVTTYTFTMPDENFTVEVTAEFQRRISISDATITLAQSSYTYDGTAKEPAVSEVMVGNTALTANDYTVSYSDNINIGTSATVTLTGQGMYLGTATTTFTISAKAITSDMITLSSNSLVYNAEANIPEVTVTDQIGGENVRLSAETDYTVSYQQVVGETASAIDDPIDVGNYNVVVTGLGNYTGSATMSFAITKAPLEGLSVSLQGWTYGAQASVPVVEGNEGEAAETFYYKTKDADDGTYTTVVPENAGNYTIKVQVAESANYASGSATADFTISKAVLTGATVTLAGWTYGATANEPVVQSPGNGMATFTYKGADEEDTKYTETVPVNAGNYTVKATIAESANYQSGTATVNFTIAKADLSMVTETHGDLTYNGSAQQLVTISNLPDGTAVRYYYSEIGADQEALCEPSDEMFTATVPTATNAGHYGILYKVDGGNNYNDKLAGQTIKVEIVPAAITEMTIDQTSMEYTGEAQTVTITSVKAGELVLGANDYDISYEVVEGQESSTVDAPVATGSYNVVVTGKGNYTGSATKSFAITKAPLENLSVSIQGWTYGAQASEPVVEGNEGEAAETFYYKTKDADDGTYTTVVPENAGNYTIKVQVAESANYASGSATADFTISKAVLTGATVTLAGWTYGATANEPVVQSPGNGMATFTYKGADEEDTKYTETVPVNAGNYTVKATIAESANYQSGTATVNFTIAKADLSMVTETHGDLTYNGSAQQLVTISNLPDGTAVRYYYSEIGADQEALCEPSDEMFTATVPTATNAGHYGILYKVDGGNNYNDKLAGQTIKVEIVPAAITEVTLVSNSLTYTGEVQEPTIASVKAGELVLTANDYDISYEMVEGQESSTVDAPVEAGTYNVVVTGQGNFEDIKFAQFDIVYQTLDLSTVTFPQGQKWTTYYNSGNMQTLPDGQNVGAFVASGVSNNEVTVTQIKYIPKEQVVLLNNATTTTTDNVFGQDVQGNLLVHATDDVDVAEKAGEGDFYGLYNGAFMRVTGTIPAGKNYLMVPNAVVPSGYAPQLTIVIDGEATGVNDVRSKMEDVRGDIYDLQGRKVQKPSKKGLYINKGHKVVVK